MEIYTKRDLRPWSATCDCEMYPALPSAQLYYQKPLYAFRTCEVIPHCLNMELSKLYKKRKINGCESKVNTCITWSVKQSATIFSL